MNKIIDKKTLRIRTPLLANNKKKLFVAAVIVVFALFLINILLNSKKKPELSASSKDDITLFLENLMIREDGLYTLLGSKAMTTFDITETLSETEEDFKRDYENARSFEEKCKSNPEHFHSDAMTLPDYKVYRERCLKNMHVMRFLHHKNLWENWLHEKGSVSNSIYKLTARGGRGLFVNVPNAISILKKYYADFSEKTGIEFDIDTIIDSIDDLESAFWNEVFKSNYLVGLMMGYGQKNSYLFDWAGKKSLPMNVISLGRFKELSRINQHRNVIGKINVDVHDLEIPYFATFEINSEDVERYSKEREKIIHFLKDKELVPFILTQLGACVKS